MKKYDEDVKKKIDNRFKKNHFVNRINNNNPFEKISKNLLLKYPSFDTARHVNRDTRKKISNTLKGKPKSALAIVRQSHTLTGRKLSKTHKKNLSIALAGRIVPEEVKEKIRATLMGHTVSEETKEKLRIAIANNQAKKRHKYPDKANKKYTSTKDKKN